MARCAPIDAADSRSHGQLVTRGEGMAGGSRPTAQTVGEPGERRTGVEPGTPAEFEARTVGVDQRSTVGQGQPAGVDGLQPDPPLRPGHGREQASRQHEREPPHRRADVPSRQDGLGNDVVRTAARCASINHTARARSSACTTCTRRPRQIDIGSLLRSTAPLGSSGLIVHLPSSAPESCCSTPAGRTLVTNSSGCCATKSSRCRSSQTFSLL